MAAISVLFFLFCPFIKNHSVVENEPEKLQILCYDFVKKKSIEDITVLFFFKFKRKIERFFINYIC